MAYLFGIGQVQVKSRVTPFFAQDIWAPNGVTKDHMPSDPRSEGRAIMRLAGHNCLNPSPPFLLPSLLPTVTSPPPACLFPRLAPCFPSLLSYPFCAHNPNEWERSSQQARLGPLVIPCAIIARDAMLHLALSFRRSFQTYLTHGHVYVSHIIAMPPKARTGDRRILGA